MELTIRGLIHAIFLQAISHIIGDINAEVTEDSEDDNEESIDSKYESEEVMWSGKSYASAFQYVQ